MTSRLPDIFLDRHGNAPELGTLRTIIVAAMDTAGAYVDEVVAVADDAIEWSENSDEAYDMYR